MNVDLHMADEQEYGNWRPVVIFGEPDIEISDVDNNQIQVKLNGMDILHPQSGEARSSGSNGITCWFIDTLVWTKGVEKGSQ